MSGDGAIYIKDVILGIDPPYLQEEIEGEDYGIIEQKLKTNRAQDQKCTEDVPSVPELFEERYPSCPASFSLSKLWLDPEHR